MKETKKNGVVVSLPQHTKQNARSLFKTDSDKANFPLEKERS
jgi:hypothetical protein